ncbi:MAG: hypothetical protein H7A46_10840 [Verrucomicrobiales bacterium]|nr:hypothetical protein [Verrucomicrobiales bacterium]
MAKPTANVPQPELALYAKLVATHPEVELKGAGMPYTSLNGHMFSFLTPAGILALRLPDAERESFLRRYQTRLCEQHGRVMKDYVEVPAALLRNTRKLGPYFAASVAHVASLKPKPTKRAARKPTGKGSK